jgi:hypothetical protein
MTGAAPRCMRLNTDQRRDHQQFVVVDIGDDLRLTGDKRVE